MEIYLKIGLKLSFKKPWNIRPGNFNYNLMPLFLIKKPLFISFRESYGDLLSVLIKLNHLLLDDYMSSILKNLNKDSLTKFLIQYADEHVAVRQFTKLTQKLIDYVSKDLELNLPNGFYNQYVFGFNFLQADCM